MNDSILTSIKKLLGIAEDYLHFDTDIIIHINSAFATLHQLGVGPEDVFTINDIKATWNQFIDDEKEFESVKTYVYLKVKIIFDPPLSSAILAAMERSASEYEWRLNVAAENKKEAQTNE